MKLTYAVVIEQYPSNYGACGPDVPGCISTAATPDEMLAMIREALTFHIEATIEHGDPIPMPTMSIDDAIAYHCQAVIDHEAEWLAEFGEVPSTLWTWFQTVEVEIPAPHAALAAATA
ncbi:type II toxin-antitoxin system HicB family antitoxin [Candidatus Poriferisodalis sp.]|uniref:type II toxin-antitoxin system HicB family antitoxin n=1 Tax=Candidatus Poriferisodalis sp. TaxID=3101277 RepID=UPI003B596A56